MCRADLLSTHDTTSVTANGGGSFYNMLLFNDPEQNCLRSTYLLNDAV